MKAIQAALFLLSAFAPSIGGAAEVRLERATDGTAALVISGEIVAGDEKTFNNLAIQLEKTTVFLDSHGGLAIVGMEIGKTINIKGFSTVVMPNTICASTCALIWLAGQPRGVFGSSKVGFHAAYTVEDGQSNVSGAGNALVGAYLQKLGLNERTIVFVTNPKPSDFDWLDISEARQLGLDVVLLPDIPSSPTSFAEKSITQDDAAATTITKEESQPESLPNNNVTTGQTPSVSRNWTILAHSDLSGYDMPGMPLSLATLSECRSACESDTHCVAYTFNAAHQACFLKSHAFEALHYTGATSGYDATRVVVTKVGKDIGSLEFRTTAGLEILSPPYLSFRGATLAWCQDKCISQKKCMGFNFYRSGECRLLREKKRSRRNTGAFSGMRLN